MTTTPVKINAVPHGCTKCWQERKKQIRITLANMDLSGKLYTINIPLVGDWCKADKEKLETMVKQELIRIKKGYIDIQFVQF